VDGPSGAGKSTIVHHLAQMLVAAGEQAHVTAEPSAGPVGQLCRELTETVTGHAMTCLYAADRHHHVETVHGVERRSIVSHFNKATKGRLVRALLTAGAAPPHP
jgi:thymidylate kinase